MPAVSLISAVEAALDEYLETTVEDDTNLTYFVGVMAVPVLDEDGGWTVQEVFRIHLHAVFEEAPDQAVVVGGHLPFDQVHDGDTNLVVGFVDKMWNERVLFMRSVGEFNDDLDRVAAEVEGQD